MKNKFLPCSFGIVIFLQRNKIFSHKLNLTLYREKEEQKTNGQKVNMLEESNRSQIKKITLKRILINQPINATCSTFLWSYSKNCTQTYRVFLLLPLHPFLACNDLLFNLFIYFLHYTRNNFFDSIEYRFEEREYNYICTRV